ncbi:MAG: NUDIX domain-containing protein, partial [Bryobacterales bacterium]|nr:NUDIX domain-containing protein [Bryobacterales bacterium]
VERAEFPRDFAALRDLPGVGNYTAAAVASIAFGLPYAALDGNVSRVVSRLAAERGDIRREMVRKKLRALAGELLDRKRPGEFNQALMELGATLCVPKQPACGKCPIGQDCLARQQGIEHQLPVIVRRPVGIRREMQLLVIEKAGKILLWKRPDDSKRLAGFWELPEREQVPGAELEGRAVDFRHTIVNTTYLVRVSRARARSRTNELQWRSKGELERVPLSTTARKALALFDSRSKS